MARAMILAAALCAIPLALSAQAQGVLHIKVVLIDADGKATPIPRHALLISDNPATSTPRRVITGADGTADVRLRPGNYTVESDRPVAFNGKAYQWTQTLDIAAGRDASLELTVKNAEIEAAGTAESPSDTPVESDPWVALPQWQDSVVSVWTPTTRASGFLIDAKGFVVTNQRAVGPGGPVEVQLTPAVKVAATLLAADADRGVAVLWIDPAAVASVRPLPLKCTEAAPQVASGQDVFTIGSPIRQLKGVTPATITRVEPQAIRADFRLSRCSDGGPVFTAGGIVLGMTAGDDEKRESRREDARVIRTSEICAAVASAEKKMSGAAAPNAARLPVEPPAPFPEAALKEAAQRRAGSLMPYPLQATAFDVSLITPVLTYGALEQANKRGGSSARMDQPFGHPLADFFNWSDYVENYPPVLLIRVTPKLVESFWTTMARGAAQTQGVAIPAIKHAKSGFARMTAFCGDSEVAPIHPFKIEHRVSESDTVYEGLYAFDPVALGPQCPAVKLVLYAEKEPQKGDTRVVDPRTVQRIWEDFAPTREQSR